MQANGQTLRFGRIRSLSQWTSGREAAAVAICAWLGVAAVATAAMVFDAAIAVSLFGDKGPVLIPLVFGSITGSLFGLLLTDRRLRGVGYRSGWAVMAGVPCGAAGVAAGVSLADAVGSYALWAFPFLVGLLSYVGYAAVSRAVLNRAASGARRP